MDCISIPPSLLGKSTMNGSFSTMLNYKRRYINLDSLSQEVTYPRCSMVLVYLPTTLGDLVWANVGKYSSTMEHNMVMGKSMLIFIQIELR